MDDIRYLVDSDWVIDYMRDVARVVRRLENLAPEGIGLSIVSLAELYEGVFGSATVDQDERRLRIFLNSVEVLPLNESICRIFGRERSRLRASGNIIGDFDLLIGATAIHHGLTLLSNNRRHFERMQGLSIVSV